MMSSKFVTMWDLNVGVDINIYGKLFKLVDCDHFTRHFLSCQGVKVPAQIPIPIRYQNVALVMWLLGCHPPLWIYSTSSSCLEISDHDVSIVVRRFLVVSFAIPRSWVPLGSMR